MPHRTVKERTVLSYLTRNWKVKIGSLVISLLLFWYVQDAKTTTRILNLRVDQPELPTNLTLASRIPSYMNVKVYGPREMMDFNVSDFRIRLTNPRPEVGPNIYRATIFPDLPEDIGAVYKREIDATLDRIMVRDIPVEPGVDLDLKEGVHAGYLEVNPGTLRVTGPESVISQMQRIKTEKVKITGNLPVFSTRVLIDQLPPFVELARNQPFDVDMKIRLLPDTINPETSETVHLITDVPVRCSNEIRGIKMSMIDRDTVDIIVSTEGPVQERLLKDRFSGTVYCPVFTRGDESEILPSRTLFNLMVRIEDKKNDPGASVLDVIPARVSLEFEKIKVNTPYEVRQGLKEHLIR